VGEVECAAEWVALAKVPEVVLVAAGIRLAAAVDLGEADPGAAGLAGGRVDSAAVDSVVVLAAAEVELAVGRAIALR
jgi:hypothetical protein